MKSKKVWLGMMGAAIVSSSLLLYPTDQNKGVYESRNIKYNQNSQEISGAFDYYELIRRNVETGTVNIEDFKRASAEADQMIAAGNRSNLTFLDHGPDNVGGRTRAILIDKNDINHIYAGSVSGGLFESTNRGSIWRKVDAFQNNLSISSMCQTDNGTIYVATGHDDESFNGSTQNSGANGNGVFFSNDNGATFNQISGTEANVFINEIVAKGNDALIAGSLGLYQYSGGTLSNFTTLSGACHSVVISEDNQVIVGSFSSERTHVSTDGGATFTPVWGNGSTEIPGGKQRVEYAISHEKVNGKYYVYASMSSGGALAGVFLSEDNGFTWSEIAPANNGAPGSFSPFGSNRQGWFDQIISVVKGDPTTCLLGGIDLHGKSTSGNWSARSGGGFAQTSPLYVHSDQHEMQWDDLGRLWVGNDGGVFFSDDNGFSFREANRGYNVTQFYRISASAHGDVAGGAQDNGTSGNYHDNHTYQEHDRISGNDGFACDISFMNRDVVFSTSQSGVMYRTGDRGFNSSTITASNIPASFGLPGSSTNSLGSFYTNIELYENPNDINSTDYINYTPTQSLTAGTVVQVPSATTQQFIDFTITEDMTFLDTLLANPALTIQDILVFDDNVLLPVNLYELTYTHVFGSDPLSVGDSILIDGTVYNIDSLATVNHYFGTSILEPGEVVDMGPNNLLQNVPMDTAKVQDTRQSWLAFGLGDGKGLWLTRNAMRFSALHDGFLQAGGNINGEITEMEFSKDGDHLYVGTATGRLYRLSGLEDIYSPNPVLGAVDGNIEDNLLNWNHPNTQATFTEIATFSGPVTGITVQKDNADHVIVSLGGYGGGARLQESVNAAISVSPSFTGLLGGSLPPGPCLSVLMDRNNPDIIFVGTDFGLWHRESTADNFEFCDGQFGKTPVFDLKQNWRTWDEGCYKPGQVYVGTHGRGIWTTDEYLTIEEAKDNTALDNVSDILIYPNPVKDQATLAFSMAENGIGIVKVYSLTGKLVKEMSNVDLNAGENLILLPASDLANGTYIVKLSTQSDAKTIKFIKQ